MAVLLVLFLSEIIRVLVVKFIPGHRKERENMRAGFFQYDVAHDKKQNIDRLKRCLETHSCDVIVLPELSIRWYLF